MRSRRMNRVIFPATALPGSTRPMAGEPVGTWRR